MWLSKQTGPLPVLSGADLGVTSISGSTVGVITKGEVRNSPIYGPGGYSWKPAVGQSVLVIKGGTGGEESCVAGALQRGGPSELRPGEVFIHAPGGSIYLKENGTVELCGGTISLKGRVDIIGDFYINGERYKPCNCE